MDQRISEELLKQAREAYKQDVALMQKLRALVQTEGWKAFVGLLESRLQTHSEQLLGPSGSVDGMVALEYVKGTMSGLVIARDLPSVIIAAIEQLVRERAVQGGNDDDDDGA